MAISAFDVKSGILNLNPRSTAPSSAKEGDYYHDDGTGANDAGLYQYKGGVWELVGSGGVGGTPIFDIIEQFDAEDQDVTGFTNVATSGTDPIAGTYSYTIGTFPAEFPTVTLEDRSKGKRVAVIGQAVLASGSCRMLVKDQTSAVLGSIFFNATEVTQFRLAFDTALSTTSLTFEVEDDSSATGLKIDDIFFTDDSIKSSTEFNEASEVFVSNFSSFAGSGANSIFRFSVLEESIGTDITYNASAGTFTVNSPGIYHMSGSVSAIAVAGLSIAIVRNSTTFGYGSEMLAFMEASATTDQINVATAKFLQAGDVIRFMQNANNAPGSTDRARFKICKVGSSSVFNSHVNIGNMEEVTVTGSWTTNTTYTAFRRQMGDHYQYDIRLDLSGAPNAAALNINLPSGDVIDTGKLSGLNANTTPVFGGTCHIADISAVGYVGVVTIENSTTIRPRFTDDNASFPNAVSFGSISNTAPVTFASGDFIQLTFSVPIIGLSATTITGVPVTTTTIDLTGSGDFTGGELKITRVGDQVTINDLTNLTFASSSNPVSAVGLIPAWARPSRDITGNVFVIGGSNLAMLYIADDGQFQILSRNYSGTPTAITFANAFSLSYNA